MDPSPCFTKNTVWKHSQNIRDYIAECKQSVSSTARVFIRQGDRFTPSRTELLTSRKKQIRHGDQLSNRTIVVMAECKQHCKGAQKVGGQVHSFQDGAFLQGVQHQQEEVDQTRRSCFQ